METSRNDNVEKHESIPWDALVTDDTDRRRRWVAMGAAGLVAAAVAASTARVLFPAGIAAPPPTAVSSPASVPVSSAPAETGPPLSESDLLAATPGEEALLASAHAVWFVSDFFTLDGSEVTRSSVARRLPAGSAPAAPDRAQRSFVESAIPVVVTEVTEARYVVTVVVRSLTDPDGEGYRREPARAVEVVVDVGGKAPAVVDLPRPVPLPPSQAPPLEVEEAEPPPEVVSAAIEQASVWGEVRKPPLAAGRMGEAWRLVLTVVDASGLEWPAAVWLDASGAPLPAGG